MEAAVNVAKEGKKPIPEIMVPLTVTIREMTNQSAIIRGVAEQVFKEKGTSVHFHVGTMIELPRACVVADEIAKDAEFFSFGTNDLTHNHLRVSRAMTSAHSFRPISSTAFSRTILLPH